MIEEQIFNVQKYLSIKITRGRQINSRYAYLSNAAEREKHNEGERKKERMRGEWAQETGRNTGLRASRDKVYRQNASGVIHTRRQRGNNPVETLLW